MNYDNGTRELVLGVGRCYCGDGRQYARITCSVCKGTGAGPKGGYRGCKHCNGHGTRVTKDVTVDCNTCGGTTVVADNWYTRLPISATKELAKNIVVVRTTDNEWSTNHKDVAHIFDVQDYGDMWHRTEAEIAEIVAAYVSVQDIQACHVVQEPYYERDDKNKLRMADGVLVEVARYGYVVKPLFIGREERNGIRWAS